MQQLKDLVARRHQLVEMMTAEKNRLSGMSQFMKEDIEDSIKWLQTRVKQNELPRRKQRGIRIKKASIVRGIATGYMQKPAR
jgi:transposase